MAQASEIEKLERRYAENPKGRNFAPLADAYRKAGQLDQAVELCKSGLEHHPDYVSAHIVYGRCLIDQRNDAAADQVFRHVLELDPENVIAFKVLAEIAERGSRLGDTVEWLTKLLAADPMNGDAAEALARAKGRAAQAARSAPVAPVAPAAPTARSAPPAAPTARAAAVPAPPPPAAPPRPAPSPEPPPAPEPFVISDLVVEHPEERPAAPLIETGLGGADFETFDGVVKFDMAAGSNIGTEGLELQEEIVLKPAPIEIEGLARTQYEGSGLFKMDGTAPTAEGDTAREDTAQEEETPPIDLPLIMPDEMVEAPPPPPPVAMAPPAPAPRRSTPFQQPPPPPPVAEPKPAAVKLSDDDGAADTLALSRAQPVVTETMAELYLKQGHQEEALRVYQALQRQRPSDSRLRAKVETLSGGSGGGGRGGGGPRKSARAFLQGILATRLGAAPAGSDAGGLSAQLDNAFGVTPEAPGEPTRAAHDNITLDALFGEDPAAPSSFASEPEPEPPLPATPAQPLPTGGGFSFDEFFGSGGAPDGAPGAGGSAPAQRTPPRASGSRARPAEDEGDLDQFQSWLKGLKS